MRIGITTVQVPFITGGAENLAQGLCQALKRAGHETDLITMPFHHFPPDQTRRDISLWEESSFTSINGYGIDRLIGLMFPAYLAQHENAVFWMLHQHRAVYDLFGTPYDGGLSEMKDGAALQKAVVAADNAAFRRAKGIYTISRTVVDRLKHFNDVDATALYHPPFMAEAFHCAEAWPYLFCPSRLETLKRQDLLIRAIRRVKAPVHVVFAGDGGQRPALLRLAEQEGVSERVRFVGHISHAEKVAYYAHSLGVFFGPHNEDYGYVTLEAMLASKPVITCTDSGGPLEFIRDTCDGFVVPPEADSIAEAIDKLWNNRSSAAAMGRAGNEHYRSLGISWGNVVQALLS